MSASTNLVACNFSSPQFKSYKFAATTRNPNPKPHAFMHTQSPRSLKHRNPVCKSFGKFRKGPLPICQSSPNPQKGQDPVSEAEVVEDAHGGSAGGVEGRDWTTSFLLFLFWAGVMYYVFILAPNQTPSTDVYFLKKLFNLAGDDGFVMNRVFVSVWYLMGLWPLLYSMLLLPSGRSSDSRIPVWPFLVLSCVGGAYALLPYFVLWKPPPSSVKESDLKKWPLSLLESKLTAGVTLAAGLGLIVYAGLAGGDVWKEFFQYFRGSRLVHATSVDFVLMSAFAPFWVYNDITNRKWFDEGGAWLLPLSVVPFLGPAFYILLRPSLSATSVSPRPDQSE